MPTIASLTLAVLLGVHLAGVDLTFGTCQICGIGVLLLLAGAFSWSTNGGKAKKARAQLDTIDQAIAQKRREIAEATE